jgi:hypothetical protein
VVSSCGYVPINDIERNLVLNVDSSMWINKPKKHKV